MSEKKTKIPSKPLDATKKNSDGQAFMNVILLIATRKGYNECFGHGKNQQFHQHVFDNEFDEQGLLNGFEKPSNTPALGRRIQDGIKTLDSILEHAHSSGLAAEGEQYPVHLASLVKTWKTLKKGAEDAAKSKTQSQINRVVQDKVMGNRPPLGDDTNAQSRSSTRKENIQNGLVVADKGGNLPGALVDSDSDLEILTPKEGDEANKTDGANKPNGVKKRRSSATKVPESVNKAVKSGDAIASALNNFSSSMNKTVTKEELEMKQGFVAHTKELENQKMKLEQDRMKMEQESIQKKYDYKKHKIEKEEQLQRARMEKEDQLQREKLLQDVYQSACERYKNEDDVFLKEMYKQDVKDARVNLQNWQNNYRNNNTQVPPVPALQGGDIFHA